MTRLERRHLWIAIATAAALAAVAYLAYVKELPFQSRHEIRAAFITANQLEPDDPVRISGIDVGEVREIEAGPRHTSIVTMEVDPDLELRSDARLAIKPRLAFEGNFYVDLRPGSATAERLPKERTIPSTQTTIPVQLDELLSSFTDEPRRALGQTIRGLADGLSGSPSGAAGLRDAARELSDAAGSVTTAARAAQGTRAGDLARSIDATEDVTTQLASDPRALADAVTNFNRVFAVLAEKDDQLAATIQRLDGATRVAPGALRSISAALPSVDRFTLALRPALRVAPGPLRDAGRAIDEIAGLARTPELPTLLDRLEPVTRRLPAVERELTRTLPGLTALTRCLGDVVVPTLNQEIEDGPNSTGRPAWQDIVHLGPTLAGGSPNFDGNGTTIRLGLTQGEQSLQLPVPGLGTLIGGKAVQGVNPTWLGYGVEPPYRPDADCAAQRIPDFGARSGGPPTDMELIPTPKPTAASRQRSDLLGQVIHSAGQPAGKRAIGRLADLLARDGKEAP